MGKHIYTQINIKTEYAQHEQSNNIKARNITNNMNANIKQIDTRCSKQNKLYTTTYNETRI